MILAAILNSLDISAREEADLLNNLWVMERAFLAKEYRTDQRKLLLDVAYWQRYFSDEATIDAEFPAIQNDLQAVGGCMDENRFVDSDTDLSLYFKSLRFRILFVGKQDYIRVKLRTLMSHYGYQRRSANFVAYVQRCLVYFHLEPSVRGTPCEINEIALDDMMTIRVE